MADDTLDLDAWTGAMTTAVGRCNAAGFGDRPFSGRVDFKQICDFKAYNIRLDAERIIRTPQDIRLDPREHYCAVFMLDGRSRIEHGRDTVMLEPGGVAIVDAVRPLSFQHPDGADYLTFYLPRDEFISHVGGEPAQFTWRNNGTLSNRLLYDLVRGMFEAGDHAAKEEAPYLHLAIYDLLGALIDRRPPQKTSLHNDRSFQRISEIIRDRFADPELTPSEVAAEAGISLRYVQKMFTERGTTCGAHIQSLRLDHAQRLIQRRAAVSGQQSLAELAYLCGFRDYSYFSRKFRDRFGHAPGTLTATEPAA